MSIQASDVGALVDEYHTLVDESRQIDGEVDWQRLRGALVVDGEWTAEGADQLLTLATDYGSFMLRNVLALALALGIEDGELGL